MENRLIPAEVRLLPGTSASEAVNANCLICHEPLSGAEHIILHPACRNACCADEFLEWLAGHGNSNCVVCRGELGDLRPHDWEFSRERYFWANNGLDQVRSIVGRVFDAAPLVQRVVSRDTPLLSLVVGLPSNHLGMIGLEEEYHLPDEMRNVMGHMTEDYHLAYAQNYVEAYQQAQSLRRRWLGRGVLTVTEYMFPEYSPHTRFIIPNQREIRVASSIESLRAWTQGWRAHVRELTDTRIRPGHWLPRTLSPTELMAMNLFDQNGQSSTLLVQRISRWTETYFRDNFPDDPPVTVVWAVWQTNNPIDSDRLFAVPRIQWPAPLPAGVVPALYMASAFVGVDRRLIPSDPNLPGESGRQDPLLYNFAAVFDERWHYMPAPPPPPPPPLSPPRLILIPGFRLDEEYDDDQRVIELTESPQAEDDVQSPDSAISFSPASQFNATLAPELLMAAAASAENIDQEQQAAAEDSDVDAGYDTDYDYQSDGGAALSPNSARQANRFSQYNAATSSPEPSSSQTTTADQEMEDVGQGSGSESQDGGAELDGSDDEM